MRVRRVPSLLLVSCALLAPGPAALAPPDDREPAPPFRVERLAPDVYAVVQLDPLGLANHANSLFVVDDGGVLVVDAQFTRARTRAVRDAIARVTDASVDVVVTTHWHDDHAFGLSVWAEAFPDARFVMQRRTRDDLAARGAENRAGQAAGAPAALDAFAACLAAGRGLDGAPLDDDARAAYASTIAIVREYVDEVPGFRPVERVTTFDDALVLEHGGRTIEVLHLGPGVTPGDTVVWLPDAGVLAAGDLVDDPVPFAYGCDVDGWRAALARIAALHPRVVVPGHGGVQRGEQAVQRLAGLLASVRAGTIAARARGDTLEQALGALDLAPSREARAGASAMTRFLFDEQFVRPFATAVWESLDRR